VATRLLIATPPAARLRVKEGWGLPFGIAAFLLIRGLFFVSSGTIAMLGSSECLAQHGGIAGAGIGESIR
jgi:hypothetical protein